MSQTATLRALDADLHAAFAGAGWAGFGAYRGAGVAPGAPAEVDRVRLFVNRGVQRIGEFGQILAARDEVEILRDDIDKPGKDASVVVDGVRYLLAEKASEDESKSTWVVRRG